MMRRIRLRNWLILGYGAVLAVAAIGLGLGLIAAIGVADTSTQLVDNNFAAVDAGSRLRRLIGAEQLELTRRLAQGTPAVHDTMPAFIEQASSLLDELRTRGAAIADQAALDKVQAALARLDAAIASADEATAPGSAVVDVELANGLEAMRAASLEHYQRHYDRMVERGHSIQVQSERLAYALALLGISTVAVGIWASLRIASRLSTPMEQLVRASDRVATGDFTVRTAGSSVAEADRVAQRFNEMVAALERFHAMNLDRIVAERRRLDQVIAHIDDGLVIFDQHGRMERVNPVAALQLRLDPAGAIGCSIGDLVDMPALDRDVTRMIADPRAQPEANSDLVVGDEGDGGRRTLTYSLLPFSDTAQHGLILVLRDVTDQRRFERLRTEFVLRASHELRTPTTGMRMALGLLIGKVQFTDGSREAELFATLHQETERLVLLIGELFDLSRLYAGTYPHTRMTSDPADLLQRAMQRFGPVADDAGVGLALVLSPGLPTLDLDAAAIERVLDNLTTNALRHTPSGGRVELGARVDTDRLALWVSDTGEGIAPQDRARVFEPFMQFGGKVGGAGLGLAMCREIVEQHRGRIQLDSTVGQGSRFTVWLPL